MNEKRLEMDLLGKALERNLRWIQAADAKIFPTFAINGAMLAALTALLGAVEEWNKWIVAVPLAAILILIPSIVFLAIASFPRLKSSQSSKGSLVYFSDAISHNESDYIKRFLEGPTSELVQDLGRQAYRSAEIADIKYRNVRRALLALFFSMPLWLGAVGCLGWWLGQQEEESGPADAPQVSDHAKSPHTGTTSAAGWKKSMESSRGFH